MAPSSICISQPARESKYYTASDLRRVISQLGFAVTYVKGASMRPLIWGNNHYVAIAPLQGKAKIGDILAFEQIRRGQTAYIVHRLIKVESIDGTDIYVMRGDNCLNCERIREEDIIGVVTEIIRKGRWKPWHAIPLKHISMDSKCYKLYKMLWMNSWPVRKVVYGLRMACAKIYRRTIKPRVRL